MYLLKEPMLQSYMAELTQDLISSTPCLPVRPHGLSGGSSDLPGQISTWPFVWAVLST